MRAQSAPLTLTQVLASREAALAALHAGTPSFLETSGSVAGSGLLGTFHTWNGGGDARSDEQIGLQREQTYRIGTRVYAVNPSGNVRRFTGLLLRRSLTDAFLDRDGFVSQPQYDALLGTAILRGGRAAYAIRVSPPGGQPETVYLDARTFMIDRISYAQDDGTRTMDYGDYRALHGAVVALREVQSNGDHAFDITSFTTHVVVDRPIPAALFAVPAAPVVAADGPVRVPLTELRGHYYVHVSIRGHRYLFLLDSGAQSVVLDTHVAKDLGLPTQGDLEVSGANRMGGLSYAALPHIAVGAAVFPVRTAAVLSLGNITGSAPLDGILGYPCFAEAELRVNPDTGMLTIAKPGSLPPRGAALSIDVDRQLPEIRASINGSSGRFVLDTGNNSELLLYESFVEKHQELLPIDRRFAQNFGVGGSVRALRTTIGELQLGAFRLYNRITDIILAQRGAFADRFDAGNIGTGVLRNFIFTFDEANDRFYVTPSEEFSDGRYRSAYDTIP